MTMRMRKTEVTFAERYLIECYRAIKPESSKMAFAVLLECAACPGGKIPARLKKLTPAEWR